ncbi:hypothetical protein M404DRAFT_995500 [Pisolithus tinctorius Marx 270]|uniref:Uncharacterized protein n=1 Tax=Pisolithus tinctorius Marx 270 TaxID=870435 RepID=A0A0C3PNB6_PISTI|nr:hypothetical protein M404DRAFT_995500 [Pisolithus tinctorius Marx 270]
MVSVFKVTGALDTPPDHTLEQRATEETWTRWYKRLRRIHNALGSLSLESIFPRSAS